MNPQIDIVGVGLASLDILIRTDELPSWGHGVRLNQIVINGGGPVATALVTAQRLGSQTAIITTYGNDRLGEIKRQTLVEEGLDVSHMVQRAAPENHAILVTVQAQTGERFFSPVENYGLAPLQPAELNRDFITSAKILHLDGCSIQAALQAAQWMRFAGRPVMLDGAATCGPISEDMHKLVSFCDILICGSGFGPALTGRSDIWEAGRAILALGPQIVVQTEGKDGSYTVTRDEGFHTPAFPICVVDTTGAGDVFHGAYLFGLLRGWNLQFIALFSSAAAALKCKELGGRSGIPTFQQTIEFLRQYGIPIPE